MMRMGSLDSQVRSLISACINTDAGSDFAKIIDKVTFAGNPPDPQSGIALGAQASEALEIKGAKKTAIGALLYQAKLNTTGFVNDLDPTSQTIMSCSAAADYVQNNINTSLASDEFKRTVQGSVNGMDTPIPNADFSFDRVAQQYSALRSAQKTLSQLVDGATQTNTEIINLLFNEMITSNLNCLKADSTSKTVCQAANIQALEIERNNIQRAANQVSMLKYAGAFANYIMALIIGLGPIIIMFMMFSGVGATRSMFVAAHVTVWPILVLNVGGELVNGMICIQVATFLDSIAQSGYITQSNAIEAYKQFGIQIGTASHIMASLPVLLSMIFALGASSAMVSVAQGMAPQGADVGTAMAPRAMNAAPLVNMSSVGSASQSIGTNVYTPTGALAAISTQTRLGELGNDFSSALAQQKTRQSTIQQGRQVTESWLSGTTRQFMNRYGFDQTTANDIVNDIGKAKEASVNAGTRNSAAAGQTASTTSGTAIKGSISGHVGMNGILPSAGFQVGAEASTTSGTEQRDEASRRVESSQEKSIREATTVRDAITKARKTAETKGYSQDKIDALKKDEQVADQYLKQLTNTEAETQTATRTKTTRDAFVAYAGTMDSKALVHSATHNPAMQRFLMSEAKDWGKSPEAQPYLRNAEQQVKNYLVDVVGGDAPMAKQAAIVHMAAAQLAADNSAKPEARDQALALLMKEASVVSGQNFAFAAPEPVKFERLKPSDEPKENDGKPIVEKVETAPPLPGNPDDYTPKKVSPPKAPNLPNASSTPTPPLGQELVDATDKFFNNKPASKRTASPATHVQNALNPQQSKPTDQQPQAPKNENPTIRRNPRTGREY